MEMVIEQRKSRRNNLLTYRKLLVAGALVFAACGGDDDDNEASPSSILPPTTSPRITSQTAATESLTTPAPPTAAEDVINLVFDDLGGGSPIIQVYPGVTEVASDKQSNGTFNDGDSVPAECKTEGRTVSSDPSAGEEERSSNEWIRILGSPGLTQYATATYIENPEELLEQLPDC